MLSIVSTYKNRRHHIEQTIPTWVNQSTDKYEIIVVDYDTDDDLEPFLSSITSRVPIVHVACRGLPVFNLSHARNIGGRHAVFDWIMFVDIDTVLPRCSVAKMISMIEKDCYFAATDSSVIKDIINGGFMMIPRYYHNLILGFNESLKGWGYEDIDYKHRLELAGLTFKLLGDDLYKCIDHEDIERTQCYDIDKERSWTVNRQIALQERSNTSFGIWKNKTVTSYGFKK